MACSPCLPPASVTSDERDVTALARLLADIAEPTDDVSEGEVTDLPPDLLLALAARKERLGS